MGKGGLFVSINSLTLMREVLHSRLPGTDLTYPVKIARLPTTKTWRNFALKTWIFSRMPMGIWDLCAQSKGVLCCSKFPNFFGLLQKNFEENWAFLSITSKCYFLRVFNQVYWTQSPYQLCDFKTVENAVECCKEMKRASQKIWKWSPCFCKITCGRRNPDNKWNIAICPPR